MCAEDTIPEAPAEGDDEDLGLGGGGGGGKRWVRVYPVGLGRVGREQPAVFLARRREVRVVDVGVLCVHVCGGWLYMGIEPCGRKGARPSFLPSLYNTHTHVT